MRTIKFRGKRIDNGEWIYGNLFVPNRLVSGVFICHETNIADFFPLHEQGKPLDFDETGITLGLFYEVHPESIGQFTGLLDKNCMEIYDGDIMKIQLPMGGFWGNVKSEKTGAVRYEAEKGGFIVEWEYSKNQHHIQLDCDIAYTGEITGNIHDKKAKSCNKPCSPSDMHKGGKCDLNGCYED